MMKSISCLMAVLIFTIFSQSEAATVVTLTGSVNGSFWPFPSGQPVTATFKFDDKASYIDTDSSQYVGAYPNSIESIELHIGGYYIKSNGRTLIIDNKLSNSNADYAYLNGYIGTPEFSTNINQIAPISSFSIYAQAPKDSVTLPTMNSLTSIFFDALQFGYGNFYYNVAFSINGHNGAVQGFFDKITVTQTPIPGTLWLFGFGLILTFGLAKSKYFFHAHTGHEKIKWELG